MDTIIIELKHQKALQLLLDLEELSLIRVLKRNIKGEQNLSDKYAGKLSQKDGAKILENINKSRDEWERNI